MTNELGDQDQSDADQPPRGLPLQGQISHLTGRKAADGQNGLPAIDQLSFSLPDGTVHDFGPPDRGQRHRFTQLGPIHPACFLRQPGATPICPICLSGDPDTEEHVPAKPLGGAVMTMTCGQCNNNLGSKVEVDLQRWFDDALVGAGADHDGTVRGHRYLPPPYYSQAADGSSWTIVADGPLSPEVREMITSGVWRMTYRLPDPRRWRMALLKHAYLAACLYLQRIPETADARAIRADLLAARDTPKSAQAPESAVADRLVVYRSHVGKQGPALALVAKDVGDDTDPEFFISLAGALAVSWPLTDLPPGTWKVVSEAPAEDT